MHLVAENVSYIRCLWRSRANFWSVSSIFIHFTGHLSQGTYHITNHTTGMHL